VSTITLRHRGRKSGELYEVQVWAATLDGTLYVASLDDSRNWVRNLRAAGSVGLLEAEQERSYAVTEVNDEALMLRFRRQTRRDHPFVARLLPLFNRGTRTALFKLT
jgi:ribosomal protein L18